MNNPDRASRQSVEVTGRRWQATSHAYRWSMLAVVLGAILGGAAANGQETPTQKYLVSVERIWDRAGHSAFTDLVLFEDVLYCAFREGSGHIPGQNGVVRVIRSADGMNWKSLALLQEPQVDLRDPKLSVSTDGRLMVNMGASFYHGSERKGIESRVAFYDRESDRFDPLQEVALPAEMITGYDWLWRVTWHGDEAWGCVQQVPSDGPRSLHLVRSRDGVRYQHVAELDVDHPTETTLRFRDDGTMLAMARRTGSPAEGWLGAAKPPYTEWKFTPTERRFGGPNFVRLPDGSWLASSRGYGERPTTELWWLNPETAEFRDLLSLPSGGDTSYAGLVVDQQQNRVLISYYSSHEGKAAIYLATLRLDALQSEREPR